ncbi:hypothetical protein [Marinoscillum pacificum]|uniref:hypothetical protein n=1 Tax=Marinoscillum pacificum TaxID=392723 RepID=UPI0021588C0D|nr:hypothetical protein [Marinoscillum pacificum]
MKNYLTLIFLATLSNLTLAQEYPNLKKDNSKDTDSDNTIFSAGTQLIFEVINHTSPEDTMTVQYAVLSIKKKDKTNKGQTEVGITYSYSKNLLEQTGIVETDKNLLIHPPRNGQFKALEIYPFPYIKYNLEAWTDKLEFGGHWIDSIDNKTRILLNLRYSNSGVESIITPFGDLECSVIKATSKSELGQFNLTSYYHEMYGFVKLLYESNNKPTFEFLLSEMKKGPAITEPYELLFKK